MLGLHFCARAFSSCGEWGPLFIAVRGPLTLVASIVAQHRLQTRRLSSCGSRAQLLRGMWDLPRPGLEPASPALAGRLSTTAPPGKPCPLFMMPFSSGSLVWISCFRLKKGHELSSLAGNPNHMVSWSHPSRPSKRPCQACLQRGAVWIMSWAKVTQGTLHYTTADLDKYKAQTHKIHTYLDFTSQRIWFLVAGVGSRNTYFVTASKIHQRSRTPFRWASGGLW